jgi:acetyl esterase
MPLDPQAKAMLDAMPPMPDFDAIPLELLRAGMAQGTLNPGEPEPIEHVENRTIPGPAGEIPVRIYRPAARGPLPVLVFFHGGGFVLCNLDTHDGTCRSLANQASCVVVSVDYRLAPEHRYPAALDDSLAAIRWLAANAAELGGDGTRLAVAGDSAGGNLAAVAARRLRELVRFQVLIYPVIEPDFDTASYRDFAQGHGLSSLSMQRFWRVYLDGADPADPDAAPMRADDLAGVAPAYVLTAEEDVLRDEGEAYAAALRAAGVPTELVRWPGTIHGFFRWLAVTPDAREAVGAVGERVRNALVTE